MVAVAVGATRKTGWQKKAAATQQQKQTKNPDSRQEKRNKRTLNATTQGKARRGKMMRVTICWLVSATITAPFSPDSQDCSFLLSVWRSFMVTSPCRLCLVDFFLFLLCFPLLVLAVFATVFSGYASSNWVFCGNFLMDISARDYLIHVSVTAFLSGVGGGGLGCQSKYSDMGGGWNADGLVFHYGSSVLCV